MSLRYAQLLLLLAFVAYWASPSLAQTSCTVIVDKHKGQDYDYETISEGLADSRIDDGKVLCIREGVYYETLSPSRGGSSGAPVTIQAAPGHERRVVVSGAAPMDPSLWTQSGSNWVWDWNAQANRDSLDLNSAEWFTYTYAIGSDGRFVNGPDHVQRREMLIARTSVTDTVGTAPGSDSQGRRLFDGHVMMPVASQADLGTTDLDDLLGGLNGELGNETYGVYGTFFVDTDYIDNNSNTPGAAPARIIARFHGNWTPTQAQPMIARRTHGFLPTLEGSPGSSAACGASTSPGYLKVRGIVFRHFNNAEQVGAVCPGDLGSEFIDVAVEFTNGTGVLTGNHSGNTVPGPNNTNVLNDETGKDHTFIGVRFSYNGQMGLGGECDSCKVIDSEISYNNWKGFNHGWEAGGTKISFTQDMVFRRVQAIGNRGPGIWFDIANRDNTIEGSRVDGNELAGIFLEYFSEGTLVQHNVVSRTRRVPGAYNHVYNADAVTSFSGVGIAVSVAPNNHVYHNTVVNNEGNGIFVQDDERRDDAEDDIGNDFTTDWQGAQSVFVNNVIVENLTLPSGAQLPNGVAVSEIGGSEFEVNDSTRVGMESNDFVRNMYLKHNNTSEESLGQKWYLLAARDGSGVSFIESGNSEGNIQGNGVGWRNNASDVYLNEEVYLDFPSGSPYDDLYLATSWTSWVVDLGLGDPDRDPGDLPSGGPSGAYCYNAIGASPEALLSPNFLDGSPSGCASTEPNTLVLADGDTLGSPGTFSAAQLAGKNVFIPHNATVFVNGTLTLIAGSGSERTYLWISGQLRGIGPNPKVEVTDGTEAIIRPLGTYDVDGDLDIENPISCIVVELGGFVRISERRDIIADNGGFIAVKGGTVVLGDNAKMIQKGTGSADIQPGSQFALGDNARVAFYNTVDLIGTAAEPIQFVRSDPSQAWDYVSILGNGSTVKYVLFDGGTKNLDVAAQNVVIDHVTSRNGWRNLSSATAYNNGAYGTRSSMTVTNSVFENASTVGFLLYNANGTVKYSDIKTSDEEGVWMSNSTVNTFEQNDVIYNGSSSDAGIRMRVGTLLDLSYYALNRVQGNRNHEIHLSSSAVLYMEEGHNSVCDSGDPGTTGKYVYDETSNYPNRYENWWGTSYPSGSMFYGGFNYYPAAYSDYVGTGSCLSSANAPAPVAEEAPDYILASIDGPASVLGSQGGSTVPLIVGTTRGERGEGIERTARDPAVARQAIRDARAALVAGAAGEDGPALLTKLHALQTYDRTDALGERAATEAVFETYRAAFGTGGPLHAVSERAVLVGLYEAMAADRIDDAKALLARLDGPPISREAQQEVAEARVNLLALEGRFDEALASVQANADHLDADYVELVSQDLAAWAEIAAASRSPQASSAALRSGAAALATETFETALLAPYPNPSRRSAVVPFTLAETAEVTVTVYDLLGRSVRTVLDAERGAGRHEARLDGAGLAAGAYVVRMMATVGGRTESFVTRITVVR